MSSDQLRQAVQLAFDPSADPALKAQATEFCEQLRASQRGWELCAQTLALVAAESPAQPLVQPVSLELRFFCLQVIEDVLRGRHDSLAPAERMLLRQTVWGLLPVFVLDPACPSFIRNKLFVDIVLLFKHQYPAEWPTFFDQLFETLAAASGQRDMVLAFLRICLTIDEEVVSQYFSRGQDEATRNNAIKDWMREGPIGQLVKTWLTLLRSSFQTDGDVATLCLKLFGAYVSWVDINLIIQPDFVEPLLGFLAVDQLQIAACECLAEIVGKGMKVGDKLQLLRLLQLPHIITTLDDSDEDFEEPVAKLINIIGLELCSCWQDATSAYEREQALAGLAALFPMMLKYLVKECDDTVSALLPSIHAHLQIMRRLKQTAESQLQLRENLAQLLQALIQKMKYLDGHSFKLGAEAGEEEALFAELRKSLKSLMESIASIDAELFVSCISSTVLANLDLLIQGAAAGKPLQSVLKWPDVEVTLFMLHIFIEAKIFKTSPVYVLDGGVLSPLGQMLSKMFESDVASYPHASIPILFFEIVVRYSQFLEQCQHYLPQALQAFVDARGLHHSQKPIRVRLNYLFLRFVKSLRPLVGAFVDQILESIQDLLAVDQRKLALSALARAGTGIAQPDAALTAGTGTTSRPERATEFDSQLYLFEAVGHLISSEAVPVAKRHALLQALLSPVIFMMESRLQQPAGPGGADEETILLLADAILAIGSISKGFPDFPTDSSAASSQTVAHPAPSGRMAVDGLAAQIFQEALRRILLVLQSFSDDSRIREASRSALQCMVGCVGPVILDHLPTFLSAGMLSSSTATELVDFLPFVGLMIHKFKSSIVDILGELWCPLRDKIFLFLNQPAAGTDDFVQQLSLRRAYLTLLAALFNSDLAAVLTSPANFPHINNTLLSILLCLDENSDAAVHKLVFSLFSKMVFCWAGDGTLPGAAFATANGSSSGHAGAANGVGSAPAMARKGSGTSSAAATASKAREPVMRRCPLSGFNQFVFESIVPAMFELPLRASFNPSDGQAMMLLGEIANLHKTAFEVLGMEYAEFLSKAYLPSRGCPEPVAQLFASNLVALDRKDFKKYLQVRSASCPDNPLAATFLSQADRRCF
ncbi:pre-tRNA nuclear export protein [Polyrhizophydium stewartii]|uniref:Exportin-T n=1 Tax=Polyrhizophydium stewartii TaxID=2732419 RepID=A0ABR4NAX3_9FUNG